MQLSLAVVFVCAMKVNLISGFIEEAGKASGAEESVRQAARAAELTAELFCKGKKLEFPEGFEEKLAAGAPKYEKTCTPGWDEKHEIYYDPMCIPYPTACALLPKPEETTFSVFTEMAPCFTLKPCVIEAFAKMRDENPSTPMKCMHDVCLAFFYACYPGTHPMVMYKMAANGEMADGAGAMAEGMARKAGPAPPSPF